MPDTPTSAVRIRPGTDADMSFFREMEFETTWYNLSPAEQQTTTPASVREALAVTHELLLDRPGSAIFLAEGEGGERVGLLWFGENRNLITGESEAWVYNVSVVAAHRGKGVGGLLMAHAEAYARQLGYPSIGLMVAVHNDAARRLYARLGFAESNLVMRRRLK
jgi:ribosomal protein S18 acetylase RimI-like enzyme